MEYLTLFFGVVLLMIFARLLLRNRSRSGFIHALFRFDTLAGIIAALYLVFDSFLSIVAHA